MKFGPVPPGDAKGGIVVHSIRKGGLVLKKGSVVGDADIAALRAAGISSITIARIEPDDVPGTAAADPQAAPLPDREPGHAAVASQHPSRGVDDRAGPRLGPRVEEPRALPASDEAHVHALGLLGGAQPEPRRLRPHLSLRELAHR